MGKSLTDGPISIVAASVFNDGDVSRFTRWCALVVGLEGVVFLINDDIDGVVAGEFTHFHLLNVRKLVPVCVATLVASHPNVLTVIEITQTVVVQDGHGVRPVRGNSHVVVAVAVEIANSDVHRVAVCGIGSCNRSAGRGGKGSGGAQHHQHGQENTTHSGLREVVLGKHGHHLFFGWPVRI